MWLESSEFGFLKNFLPCHFLSDDENKAANEQIQHSTPSLLSESEYNHVTGVQTLFTLMLQFSSLAVMPWDLAPFFFVEVFTNVKQSFHIFAFFLTSLIWFGFFV